jgi:4-hydroxy-tetrahydrodipicolinate synthase
MTTPATSPAPKPGSTRVTGIIPPIPTPFLEGRLDLHGLRTVLDDLSPNVDGILVGGSLGETASLSIAERETVIRTVADHFDGELALVVSITDNAVEHSKRLSEVAGECNSMLLAASCPNYFENDIAMLEAYFAALGDIASADLCLYDNPYVSQTRLSVDDIVAIQRAAPRITHVKMTDTALGKVRLLRERLDVTVFAGDDAVLWHHLLSGAEGMMASIPMVYPARALSMWRTFRDGDVDGAYREYRTLSHFIQCALSSTDYPTVIKAILHRRGIISSSEVRVPLVPLPRDRHAEILAAFELQGE